MVVGKQAVDAAPELELVSADLVLDGVVVHRAA